MSDLLTLALPLRTGAGLNAREHHMARFRRVRSERSAMLWAWTRARLENKAPPSLPVEVHLVRISPGTRPMDDDNLPGALKAVRDELAAQFGVDDADPRITWRYSQERGEEHGVRIEILPRRA